MTYPMTGSGMTLPFDIARAGSPRFHLIEVVQSIIVSSTVGPFVRRRFDAEKTST